MCPLYAVITYASGGPGLGSGSGIGPASGLGLGLNSTSTHGKSDADYVDNEMDNIDDDDDDKSDTSEEGATMDPTLLQFIRDPNYVPSLSPETDVNEVENENDVEDKEVVGVVGTGGTKAGGESEGGVEEEEDPQLQGAFQQEEQGLGGMTVFVSPRQRRCISIYGINTPTHNTTQHNNTPPSCY